MMKHIGISMGVLAACLVIWSLWGTRSPEGDETSAPEAAQQTDSAQIEVGSKEPELTPEPVLLEEPPIAAAEQTSDSCDELSRISATTTRTVTFAPEVEVNEVACAAAVNIISGATMQALPGLAGFDIRDFSERHPAKRLANEPDDPAWARMMEGRILGEISSLLDFPLIMVHAVCRSSVCGLIFAYPSEVHSGGDYNEHARQLADRLDIGSYYAGYSVRPDGTRFTTIYLGDADTPGLYNNDVPDRNRPSSFEDFIEESENPGQPE